MAESSNLQLIAREILVSESHEELAMIVDNLFKRQDSHQYKTSRALYDFCVSCNPGCLTLKLLKLYQSSSNGVLRFRSIYQLSETLTDLRNRKLSLDSLYEIKGVLISCLTMEETKESEFKILRKIVSCVAYNVVDLHKDKWDELGDCILTLVNSKEPVKAFHVFIDLPPVYKSFIHKFLHKILEEASNVFLDPYRVEDWSLALQVFVKMWIQLVDTGMMLVLLEALMGIRVSSVVNSVKKLVKKEKEEFLVQGLEDFERFFSREMNLYKYTKDQCHFVLDLMIKIKGFGTHLTKDIVRKIIMLVTEPDNHAIQPQDDDLQNRREEFERGWYDHLKSLSSLEVLKIFASTDLEERSREMAIRRLNCLLSDNTTEKVEIDIAEMRELQPLIISCLKEEGISFSMFKVLGEVVNHVAYEILVCQEETWYDLRDYIASSTTEFQRAVYIFQCLLMKFDDKKFLYPVMDNLYQEIIERLAPPGEVLVDNSCWVFAFTGAFCAAIHLIEDPGYANAVSEIAYKMIDSVKEIVERGMEVGLVRRAFRDVEIIVKEQLEWYSTSEYKFVKGLLWKLYAIKGMKWQSKIVLWRINVIIDRDVEEEEKERPQNDLHWLNLPAA
ncbi:Armadillo-type fold, partial [Arabidopsis thaliana x Arabidopsis arenosa]